MVVGVGAAVVGFDMDGARLADGRAVNPRRLIARSGMASCQQR